MVAWADSALRTARRCSQLLIRAQEVAQLMQDICKLAVETGGLPDGLVVRGAERKHPMHGFRR